MSSISLSEDGRWALSGSGGFGDENVLLWEVATGQCLRTFQGHTAQVTSISLSADGRWALSGSWDKTLRLWEVATGRCLRTFKGHTRSVESVWLSRDKRWALSGSSDDTVRLWEIASGKCLHIFQGHTGTVNSICLSKDGRFVLSGGNDETLRLWEFDWELEARAPADWDEGARPYLETFLTLHTPYTATLPQGREPSEEEIQPALSRRGRPSWNEQDFQELVQQLQYAGYGWLHPEGVRRELERMAQHWQKPWPLPGV
jgi:hypothetical protein